MPIPNPRIEAPELFYPGRKPVGKVKIDWSHPLARGLIRYWLGTSTKDIVSNTQSTVLNGSVAVETDSDGQYLAFAVDAKVKEDVVTPISGSQDRTFIASINHSLSNYGGILNITDSFNGAESERWTVRVDASIGLRVEIQGSGYTSSLVANNGNHFIGCRLRGSTLADHTLFVDNKSEDSTGVATVNTNSSYYLALGARNDADTGTEAVGGLRLGMLYNRALSDQEIASLHNDPYQFLIPA